MARVTIEVTPEKLAEMLADIPPEQLKIVLEKVAERLEVREWYHTPVKSSRTASSTGRTSAKRDLAWAHLRGEGHPSRAEPCLPLGSSLETSQSEFCDLTHTWAAMVQTVRFVV